MGLTPRQTEFTIPKKNRAAPKIQDTTMRIAFALLSLLTLSACGGIPLIPFI